MKTLFVEARLDVDLKPVLDAILKEVKHKRVGLTSTVQHAHQLQDAKMYLKKHGREIYIGVPAKFKDSKVKQGIHATHPGQVLGCDISSALDVTDKVDCLLYLGTGKFHPLNMLFKTDKPIYIANPFTKKVEKLDDEYKRSYLAKKAIRMSKAKESKCFGILLSTKPGQYYKNSVDKIKELAKKHGKEAVPLIFDTINPDSLLDFTGIDCYINTACPRIIEDKYPKPIINFAEFIEIFEKE